MGDMDVLSQTTTEGQIAGPLVSVCIPVYNCEKYIAKAIDSVLTQTYRDIELVVCDNCSTDGTYSILEGCRDPRIRLVRNGSNLGAVPNWNRVTSLVKGKYVKILCADDFLYPECVKSQVEILEDPANSGVLMAFCRRDVVGPDGKRIMTRGYSGKSGRHRGVEILRRSIRSGGNIVGEPGGVMFRAELLSRVGEFSGDIPWVIDLDYWSRIMALGDVYAMRDPLCAFRISTGSWSVGVAKSHTKDFRAFIAKLRREPRFGVTSLDAAIGSVMAEMNRRLRQIFYKFVIR